MLLRRYAAAPRRHAIRYAMRHTLRSLMSRIRRVEVYVIIAKMLYYYTH